MNIKFLFTAVIVFTCSFSFAQNLFSAGAGMVYLKPMSSSMPSNLKRGSYVGEHVLGDTISSQLNIFERNYVYFKTSSGAYPVEERVVLKRNLYKKVRDFNEFIVKSYSSRLVSRDSAQARLSNVLGIGIKLINFDTSQVEKDVKKLNVPTEFEKYLNNLKFQ